MQTSQFPLHVTRRSFLHTVGASLTVTAVASALESKRLSPADSSLTPAEALSQLYEGNARFVAGKTLAPHRDMNRLRETAPKQTPFAAFLGCSDSRVPIEIIFDQGFGDMFVTRIAGNIVTPECIGSLEFATYLLNAKVLYILGHTSCGAVEAASQGKEVPGQISALFQHIRPAIKAASGNVTRAVYENVKIQAGLLAESSPLIARLLKDKKLIIAGEVYQLDTGKVVPIQLGT